jgi:hypothetical protein
LKLLARTLHNSPEIVIHDAAVTNDPALKQSYASLAKEWRDIAIQLERLESQMEALKAHKNSK